MHNGDSVEIVTSPTQSPKQDWLSFVVTSKARVRIKQALREEAAKTADYAKEMLQRRFKNRKIEMDEPTLMRYIKRKGYKTVTDFYLDLGEERLDANAVIDEYLDLIRRESETTEPAIRSAEEFSTTTQAEEIATAKDVLVIDKNLTGVEYSLAKCCNPIYGDEVFGFVSTRGIKIHRMDCPNAQEMFSRFGYRVVPARWSGKGSGDGYVVTLRVVGRDDIAIVTNITSVIGKEPNVSLRSLNIDSTDGLFQGTFSVMVRDNVALNQLVKKLKGVKGVKNVERS